MKHWEKYRFQMINWQKFWMAYVDFKKMQYHYPYYFFVIFIDVLRKKD